MPRGWHQTPSGWWQKSLRGPRPPSEKWPRAGTQHPSQPGRSRAWPNKSGQQQPSPPPLQSPKPIPHRNPVNPDVAMENVQSKVARLQKAVEAVGDMGGVVVESLQAELAKAQAAAVLPPIDVQISKCKEFIERSERRLVWLEAETVIEKEALSEGSPLGQIGGSDVPPTTSSTSADRSSSGPIDGGNQPVALLRRCAPTSMVLGIVEGQGRGRAQKWPKFIMG